MTDGTETATPVKRVGLKDIPVFKQELLTLLLSPETVARVKQRQAIKEILPELVALRNAGVEFEMIAGVLQRLGMTLSVRTFRRYYNEERERADEDQLAEMATRYKRMAEHAMSQVAERLTLEAQRKVQKALEQVSRVLPAPQDSVPQAPATETPPEQTGVPAISSATTKKATPKEPRNVTAKKQGVDSPHEVDRPPMSLEEIQRRLGATVDFSDIPRT